MPFVHLIIHLRKEVITVKVKYQPMCKATFEQDGWHTIEEQPLVHSNYNATIGQSVVHACCL